MNDEHEAILNLLKECGCEDCQYKIAMFNNGEAIYKMDRRFDAGVIRVGRKYGTPNKRLLRRQYYDGYKVRRVPYGHPLA